MLDALLIAEVVTVQDIRPLERNTRIALYNENAVVLPIPVGRSFLPRSVSVEMTQRPDGKREMLLDTPLKHGSQDVDSSNCLNANHRLRQSEHRRRRASRMVGVALCLSVSLNVVRADVACSKIQVGKVVGKATLSVVCRATIKPSCCAIRLKSGVNSGTKNHPGCTPIHKLISLRLEREREREVESDQSQVAVFSSDNVLQQKLADLIARETV